LNDEIESKKSFNKRVKEKKIKKIKTKMKNKTFEKIVIE